MSLVIPSQSITKLPATIGQRGSVVWTLHPEKRDDFRDAVKSLHLHWDWNARQWVRRISDISGPQRDRLIELGHHLLAEGFPVEFPDADDDLREAAVAGEYTPECRRWLLTGRSEYNGWFRLWWGRGQDYYQEARAITGSQYDPTTKCVVIPLDAFDEVLDFVKTFDFQTHHKVSALIAEAKKRRAGAYVAAVTKHEAAPVEKAGREHLTAGNGVTVAFHLRDFRQAPQFDVTTDLFDYQQTGVEKLLPLRTGALFMDMGTGKTRCAIELAHRRRARIENVVWFCPVSLKETIAEEVFKHTTLPASELYAFDDKTTARNLPTAFWNVVGIESMSSSDRMALAANRLITPDSFVIVDESSYIKGHAATRTRRITAMAERARYRAILTGTPLSQGVEDLFGQMNFLSPDILGYTSYYSFARNHLEFSEKYPGLVVRAHNVPWLAEKLAPYVYQITKEDAGLNLPEKFFDAVYFSLTDTQREYYEQAKDEILLSVDDDDIDSYVIFQLFNALQQIASGFWNRGDERIEIPHKRVDTLLNALERYPENEKIIIWCKFIYSVEQIAAALRDTYGGDAVAPYYGDLNERERSTQLARFRKDARFFVGTQATGGHGLTLNESANTIFYENEFKYAHRVQAEDRNHRIGQTRRPTYTDLFARCGIEKRIECALSRKEDVVKSFRREVKNVKKKVLKTL